MLGFSKKTQLISLLVLEIHETHFEVSLLDSSNQAAVLRITSLGSACVAGMPYLKS